MNCKKIIIIFFILTLIKMPSFAQTEITNDMVFSILENKPSKYDQYGQGFQKAFLKLLKNNTNKEPFDISDAVVQELEKRHEKFFQEQRAFVFKIDFSIMGIMIVNLSISSYLFLCAVKNCAVRNSADDAIVKTMQYFLRGVVGTLFLVWLYKNTLITEKARKRYNIFVKTQQILSAIKRQKNIINQAEKTIEKIQKNGSGELLKIASMNWLQKKL